MAILKPHTWGEPADVACVAAVPAHMIKGCSERSDDLSDLWKLGDSVQKYLTQHHITQLETLKQDRHKLKVWESGTESPSSRKRALEDDLRASTTRLTPANESRVELSRKSSSKRADQGPTGVSPSMTQQLQDKITLLTMLSNNIKDGGDVIIQVPKPCRKPVAPSGSTDGSSKPKKPRKARLTQENFDKLKDEIKGLKKAKTTLVAKNTALITIMDANGLLVGQLADKPDPSSSVMTNTPRKFAPGSAKASGSSNCSPGLQAELDSNVKKVKELTDKLRIVEAEKISLTMKAVKYKSERKLLAKMANYALSDSD